MRKMIVGFLIIAVLGIPAAAYEVPDLNRQGSIRISMYYDGSPVSGGEMTLCRVGDIHEDNGNYSFVLSQDFAPSGISLENIQSASAAKEAAAFASKQGITGSTKQIGTDGYVIFEKLELGLYLAVQNKAAQGYERTKPFFISLPMLISDTYSYQIDAGPKVSPVTEKPKPELPQTGQSGWPIWTFLFSGAGLLLLTKGKKNA